MEVVSSLLHFRKAPMIKKFILNKYGETTVETTPFHILSVQMQGDNLVVWINTGSVELRQYVPKSKVVFTIVYTGDNAPVSTSVYISTVQHGDLVYHVYAH